MEREEAPRTMHWSARHASSFARFGFVVQLILLWQSSQQDRYSSGPVIFRSLVNENSNQFNLQMLAWLFIILAGGVAATAFMTLLRSARLQHEASVPNADIRHSLSADMVLTVVGIGLCVGSFFAGTEGMAGDVVLGTGLGAAAFAGIVGFGLMGRVGKSP